MVLAQALEGHSSYRGIIRIIRKVIGYDKWSIGTVHNILRQAAERAWIINAAEDQHFKGQVFSDSSDYQNRVYIPDDLKTLKFPRNSAMPVGRLSGQPCSATILIAVSQSEKRSERFVALT